MWTACLGRSMIAIRRSGMSGWVQISVDATSFDLSEQRSGDISALSRRLFGLVDFLVNDAGRRALASSL